MIENYLIRLYSVYGILFLDIFSEPEADTKPRYREEHTMITDMLRGNFLLNLNFKFHNEVSIIVCIHTFGPIIDMNFYLMLICIEY